MNNAFYLLPQNLLAKVTKSLTEDVLLWVSQTQS